MRILPHAVVLALLTAALNGCGFQLRGQFDLPPVLSTVYVDSNRPATAPPSQMARVLRQALEENGLQVTDDPEQATAILELLSEDIRRRTLAAGSSFIGQPREYTLTYDVAYMVIRPDGEELAPPQSISTSRNLLYGESEVFGRTEGEEIMLRDMRSDLAYTILRRLQAVGS